VSLSEPTGTPIAGEETAAGNYFVSNYPPFSAWRRDQVHLAAQRLDMPPEDGVPLGLYIHIPFCRKRCDFCYFRVYTDNDAARVHRYIDAVIAEAALYARRAFLGQRKPLFVYFGGGTPSYLSAEQLKHLFAGLQEHIPWDGAKEVTFECEPGTLQEKKLRMLQELGVTRLSLGIENFDPDILEMNNRAHRTKEIFTAYDHARAAGIPQINIDLIAGMVGETEENWKACYQQAASMAPESITIYQLEVPFNTTLYREMRDGRKLKAPIADWPTKRRWVMEAYRELERRGYRACGSDTMVKSDDIRFLYRDGLWHGADMVALGVASFAYLGGVHAQNEHNLEPYCTRVEKGELPFYRAMQLTPEETLIREFILQLKTGHVKPDYFRAKFGVDVTDRFEAPLRRHEADGYLSVSDDEVAVTRAGLLQVDRLLHEFFLEEHRGVRYA
jgi:oxygen-independent coproporphyrinogen-3 oxidase